YVTDAISHIGAPYDQRREGHLAVPDRAPGHRQARPGRARDGARPCRQRRGPLGERRGRHGRDPTPRGGPAAPPRGVAGRGPERPPPRDGAVDFFSPVTDGPSAMRYGVLIEVEEYWQSLGVLWGELLYSVTLTPGDEAKLAVLDGRWRREAEGRERPLQILARMVGTSMLGDLVSALRPELQLDALTLIEPGLDAAAADTVQLIRDRTERMSNALRRRPLGVVD